jgi:hypothetical protein
MKVACYVWLGHALFTILLTPFTAMAQLSITAGISGSWFNPERDGEGFLLEVLDENRLAAYWFTYDFFGNQQWLVGVGEIDGDRAIVPVRVTEGGIFGPLFDPNTVQRISWGTLEFSFTSCDRGIVNYRSTLEFGSGTIILTRLTELSDLQCNDSNDGVITSGTWRGDDELCFNISRDGTRVTPENSTCGDFGIAPPPALAVTINRVGCFIMTTSAVNEIIPIVNNFFLHTSTNPFGDQIQITGTFLSSTTASGTASLTSTIGSSCSVTWNARIVQIR